MTDPKNVAGAGVLLICAVMTFGACKDKEAAAGAASSGDSPAKETYGAVDPDEKPITSGGNWDVSKIENELSASMMAHVFLKNGIKIEPFAYRVKLVGMSETSDGAPPVLVFSGKECADCETLKMLYVHSVPDRATLKLTYPGDYHPSGAEPAAPHKRVRFYFGHCLSETERNLVHTSEEQVEGGRGYARTVQVFRVGEDGKVENKVEQDRFPEEAELQASLKRGICQALAHERFVTK